MNKKTRNIMIAGLGGVAVGAALGILFAPDEGKKTRAKLKKKTAELKDQISEKMENPQDMFAEMKSKVHSTLKNGKAGVKEELLAQIEALEAAIKKA